MHNLWLNSYGLFPLNNQVHDYQYLLDDTVWKPIVPTFNGQFPFSLTRSIWQLKWLNTFDSWFCLGVVVWTCLSSLQAVIHWVAPLTWQIVILHVYYTQKQTNSLWCENRTWTMWDLMSNYKVFLEFSCCILLLGPQVLLVWIWTGVLCSVCLFLFCFYCCELYTILYYLIKGCLWKLKLIKILFLKKKIDLNNKIQWK